LQGRRSSAGLKDTGKIWLSFFVMKNGEAGYQLHFFTQFTEQRDSEGKADIGPQMVQVLEWNFK
jgi:hypothetical protein